MKSLVPVIVACAACGRVGFDGMTSDAPVQLDAPDGPSPPPSVVQLVAGSIISDTIDVILPMPTGAHDLIVAATGSYGQGDVVSQVTDDAGNTYVSANVFAEWHSPNHDMVEIYYAKDSLPGATKVTIKSLTSMTRQGYVLELSNMDRAAPLEAAMGISDGPATFTPSGVAETPAEANAAIVTVGNFEGMVGAINSGSPFIAFANQSGNDAAYYIAPVAGVPYAAVWNDGTLASFCTSTAMFRPAP